MGKFRERLNKAFGRSTDGAGTSSTTGGREQTGNQLQPDTHTDVQDDELLRAANGKSVDRATSAVVEKVIDTTVNVKAPDSTTPEVANTGHPVGAGPELASAPRNLSQEALNALDPLVKERILNLIPADSSTGPIKEQIDLLIGTVEARQKECEAKFWKVRVFGHDVVVRDYVKASLDIVKNVGDVAINFAPSPGSAVWGGVKTLMDLHVTADAELCALLTVAQSITPILCRVQAYECVFTATNTENDALESLQTASIEVYSTCFKLIAHTSYELASKLRRARHALLDPGKGSELIDTLKNLETEHNRAVERCHITNGTQAAQRVDEALKNMQSIVETITGSLNRIEEGVERIVSRVKEKELDDISKVKYTDNHNSVRALRADNTCYWLVKKIERWDTEIGSGLFWLRGDVGTGKSVLSSSAIEYFRNSHADCVEDGGFAFFYCNRQEDDRKTAESILRCYLRQLRTTYRSQDDIRSDLRNALADAKRDSRSLDPATCLNQILASINLFPHTTIALDGLDECSTKDRETLLDGLDKLMKEATKPLKIYVASRTNVDITKWFEARRHVGVSTLHNNLQDIETYVTQKVDGHKDWHDKDIFEILPETKKKIVRTLSGEVDSKGAKSKGPPMFRWAYLQLNQLFHMRSDTDIVDRLGELPPDLDEAYDEIYENNTKNLGKTDKAHVDRALMWLMCAKYKMGRALLLDAIRMTPEGAKDNEVKYKALLQLCQHLVVLNFPHDPDISYWAFPHASVGEWLEKKWSLASADTYVARVCLSQLLALYRSFDPATLRKRDLFDARPQFGALEYARYCWYRHVRALNAEEPASIDRHLVAALKEFLGSPLHSSSEYQRWFLHSQKTFQGHELQRDLNHTGERELSPTTISLFAMVKFDLIACLSDWWEHADIDLSVVNKNGETPLVLAQSASVGTEMTELLIKRGVDVNQRCKDAYGNEDNALVSAAGLHQFQKIKLLVEAGADVNAVLNSAHGHNALCELIDPDLFKHADFDTVRYMIEVAKADVNVELPKTSILIRAAHGGQLEIIRYLVECAKADVDRVIPSANAGNALSAAAMSGHIEVVRYFIEDVKVDPNAQIDHKSYGSTLSATSILPVVRYLVEEAKADVNMLLKYGPYGSALAAHAAYGHLDVVKYLIEEGGADVDLKLVGHRHSTALEAARAVGKFNQDVITYLESRSKMETPTTIAAVEAGASEPKIAWGGWGGVDLDLARKDIDRKQLVARQGTF